MIPSLEQCTGGVTLSTDSSRVLVLYLILFPGDLG
jgi:hypothetical protein